MTMMGALSDRDYAEHLNPSEPEPEECENCERAEATRRDVNGIGLCYECWEDLKLKTAEILDAEKKCHNCGQVMDCNGCPTWRCKRQESLREAQGTEDVCPF